MHKFFSFVFFVAANLALNGVTIGQPSSTPFGKLDRSFGASGVVAFQSGAIFMGDAAVLTNGKIVFVNTVQRPDGYEIQVIRLLSDGAFDTSFGGDGIDYFSFADYSHGTSILAQPDGKLLIGGQVATVNSPPQYDALIFRIHENGQLDSSFGNAGKVVKDFAPSGDPNISNDGGTTLAYSGSNIIAALTSHRYPTLTDRATTFVTLVKLDGDGTIDQAFGSNGIAQLQIGNDFAGSGFVFNKSHLLVQNDEKIVVGQTTDRLDVGAPQGLESRSVISRFLPSGTADTKFGNAGIVLPHNNLSGSTSLNITADAKYVVGIRYALVRLNQNGAIDSGFGIDGVLSLGTSVDAGYAMIDSSGKITIAGTEHLPVPVGMHSVGRIFRLHSDGLPDLRFGRGGAARIDIGNDIQVFGKILKVSGTHVYAIGNCNAPGVMPCVARVRIAK